MSEFSLTEINERISQESSFIDEIKRALREVIVGQEELVNRILIGILANGHILLEGVPGLAKTLVVKSLAQLINTKFQRIQFTPDMLPADLIGTLIYNQNSGEFVTRKGPIFSNIILADEINRAPSKVQSALLEAMQERQTTIGEETYKMDAPFLVLATQNPIDQEGTYPLPEAQTDRFMLKIKVDYPSIDEERLILRKAAKTQIDIVLTPVVNQEQVLLAQNIINDIYVDEKVEEYILNLVFSTRNPSLIVFASILAVASIAFALSNTGLEATDFLASLTAPPTIFLNFFFAQFTNFLNPPTTLSFIHLNTSNNPSSNKI